MANHVSYYIEFYKMNSKAKARMKYLLDNAEKQTDGDIAFGNLIALDVKQEDKDNYSWYLNNVGPKWCHIEDFDIDHLQGYSAWSAPIQGLETLLEDLAQYDPEMITTIQYEDEYALFVGQYTYQGSEIADGIEYEWDEIVEEIIAATDELEEGDYNYETSEWINEEKQEIFWEVQWEWVHDMQESVRESGIATCV